MRTLRLIVEYDGTAFSGWQRQTELDEGRTVQGALEGAIRALTQEEVQVRAASRTDAGVHARGQVVAFESGRDQIPCVGFERGLAQFVPDAVMVRRAEEVEVGWDPRRTARGKHYRYTFWSDTTGSALDRRRAWFVRGILNVELMREAAAHLLGTHDFEAFRSTGCSAKHAVRTIYRVDVCRGAYARVHLDVVGNAFVRNMVRIIAGNLGEVGLGRRNPEDVARILASKDRTRGGMTAPPHGLCLEEVIYDDRLPPRPTADGSKFLS